MKPLKKRASSSRNLKISPRYLLYIDVLNFADFAATDFVKVERIYRILDSLNAHRHPNFKAIAFSDTILIYNLEPATTVDVAEYLVWYLIEFAEDLHRRFTGQDLFFRAVLVAGDFTHYKLKHVECFFGQALIEAYRREKGLPGVGLFITEECNGLNKYFRTARFDDNLSFVYLNRALEQLNDFTGDVYPAQYPEVSDNAPNLPWDVEFLKVIYREMRKQNEPLVRAKYLTTWDYYLQRYPRMLRVLVDSDFAIASLAYEGAWSEEAKNMQEEIQYFAKANLDDD
jgi:hypothetical protein